MRFEVSYPTGVTHEVEPAGPAAVLGRDPGCDVVLNDTKCSRRHAVIEQLEGRLIVKDTGSANGIYVNGRRVDRALLAPGDTVRLGDVRLRVLGDPGSTLDAALDDLVLADVGAGERREPTPPPAAASPPTTPRPVPGPGGRPAYRGPERRWSSSQDRRVPRAPAAGARSPTTADAAAPGSAAPVRTTASPERPLTVTLLAALWALFAPGSVAAVLYASARTGLSPTEWALAAGASAFLAGLGVAMTLGLRALSPWAWRAQVATASVGLAACPFTLASVTVLLYVTRPEVKEAFFAGRGEGSGAGASEPTFALSILAMLGLGLAVSAMAYLVLGHGSR